MSHQKIIQDLIAWIDEHIDQPLNIDVVAKKSGYSKWYLQRMFRTVTHQTLGDYIRQRRLLLAAVELRTTERPIFDIAMDLGYVSQQTFSRVNSRAGNCSIHCINTCGGIAFAKNHPWQ